MLFLAASACTTTPVGSDRTSLQESSDPCALVRRLSRQSLGTDYLGYRLTWPEGEAAKELWAMGNKAAPCLLTVLDDPDRGVAAHVILTNIYHRDRIVPRARWVMAKHNKNKLVSVYQTLNGLTWRFDPPNRSYVIEEEQLHRNAIHWREELQIGSVQ